jgi:SAM-dependent methyltransferase
MTDWDERYRQGDTPWEKGHAAPPLIELLERMEPAHWGAGPVLVPGCGLGHDVRALARINVSPLGLDLSAIAVERARAHPAVGDETYETGDFLDPDWRAGRKFSAIWEHTCFCAIDPSQRNAYAEAAAGVLVEGGLLAGVFFLTPYDPGEESAGPPHATTVDELVQRFSRWFERVDGWMPELAYPGREGREWIGLFRKLPDGSVAG